MRRSLHDAEPRQEILRRLGTLTADARRQWGTMSVCETLAHLADQLRFAIRELEPTGPKGPLTWAPLQWLGIVVLPWPHGRISTSPELLQTPPDAFEASVAELVRLIETFGATNREDLGPHPMFGELDPDLWGKLAFRHLDYHLRQFDA